MLTLGLSTIFLLLLPVAAFFTNYYLNFFLIVIINLGMAVLCYWEINYANYYAPNLYQTGSSQGLYTFKSTLSGLLHYYTPAYFYAVPIALIARWWNRNN